MNTNKEYTNQEVFDIVTHHLLQQGCMSQDSHGVCLYRGPKGFDGQYTKCAAGILIPDEVYKYEMENVSIESLIEIYPKLHFLTPNRDLIKELQYAHDQYFYTLDELKNKLIKIAIQYELDYRPERNF